MSRVLALAPCKSFIHFRSCVSDNDGTYLLIREGCGSGTFVTRGTAMSANSGRLVLASSLAVLLLVRA